MGRHGAFRGGVHPPQHKTQSLSASIQSVAMPRILTVPLHQHIGTDAICLVKPGDHVLKGEKLARADGYVSAPVHAPTSGTVIAVEERPVPHPSALYSLCVVIESDGKDTWTTLTPAEDYTALNPSALRNLLREAGIVGLGGAGFPSYIKLNPGLDNPIDTLILNGAECEPYITCDDALMRERAAEIIGGLRILRHALQAQQCVIAIEDNKPAAIAAMEKAATNVDFPIHVQVIKTIYPAGSEKQLIYTITGKEVPSNGLPLHIGVVMQNVATTAAVFRRIAYGEPLVSRVITITGGAAVNAGNYRVPIGVAVSDLLGLKEGQQPALLLMGGPMMGISLPSMQVPVIKTTNCIIAVGQGEMPVSLSFRACIRCGACADVCPVSLLPQQMFWYARGRQFDRVQEYKLFDCIECGCCAYVCPSRIPLVQYYRYAKTEIWAQEREKRKSDAARQRFEARQERLEKEKRHREEKLKKRKQALLDKSPAADTNQSIAAAVARSKAKKTPSVDPDRHS